MMEIVFEREALFAEVWATPMRKLAQKYGLSDSGLRKVCVALEIPLPGAGHWAKVAAGHKIRTPKLPPTDGRTSFISRLPVIDDFGVVPQRDDPILKAALEFEAAPENAVVVASQLTRPHRLVGKTSKVVWTEMAGLERARIESNRPLSARERREPQLRSLSGPSWFFYQLRHTMELSDDILPMRVSIELAERALRIWDAVIKACVARRMKVAVTPRGLLITQGHDDVLMRLAEKVTGKGDGRRATGALRINFGQYSQMKFEDEPERPLESQLNDLLCRVHRELASSRYRRQVDRVRKTRERAAEAERARAQAVAAEVARRQAEERLQQEAIEEEERARAVRELEREAQLVVEANAWRQADAIRAYIAHVTSTITASGELPETDVRAWLTWAAGVAEKLDPTSKRRR